MSRFLTVENLRRALAELDPNLTVYVKIDSELAVAQIVSLPGPAALPFYVLIDAAPDNHVQRPCLPGDIERLRAGEGAERIAAERRRQLEVEGWTPEHDDTEHAYGQLVSAARAYALLTETEVDPTCGWDDETRERVLEETWPWDERWWKPSGDPIRNLEKAGALIAAEIDRLLRGRARPDQTNTPASD